MRLLVLSISFLGAACLGATCAIAQSGQWGPAEDQIPPYQTHMDRRHGHDHVYPDRGAVVRDLPQGATTVNYAGISYEFVGGVWYQRLRGPAYIVVAPPIGVAVPQVPAFATSFDLAGKTYLYANDVFYRPRPDLGGYEVVNDPQDDAPGKSRAPAGASRSRLASASATATIAPGAQTAAAAPAAPTAPTSPTAPAGPTSPTAPTASAGPTASHAAPAPAKPRAAMPPVQPTTVQPTTAIVQPKNVEVAPAPPAAAPSSAASAPANPTRVAIHPLKGQSEDQQAVDRYECYRFAVGQAGFDPLSSNAGIPPADLERRDAEYSRAQAACLEARGYSVE